MAAVLHIGPPKTATTALQDDVIPRLGRPFEIKPAWARSIARVIEFERPQNLADDVIVSDEILGEFATYPPKVIAARLAGIFKGARVIFTVRDPISLFTSLYRQQVINILSNQHRIYASTQSYGSFRSADEVFDVTLEDYRRYGRGLLAMTNISGLRFAFEPHFTLTLLDFNLLTRDPVTYSEAFCKACGVDAFHVVGRSNVASHDAFDAVARDLPANFPSDLLQRFRTQYETPELSKDRTDFLRMWTRPLADDLTTFI